MAIYHLSAKTIGRSAGRSATGAAAYRAGVEITDARSGIVHDYTRRAGVLHSEIMAPEGSPEWTHDRAQLWNAVEAVEKRKDAQLCRELVVGLPSELTDAQRLALVREFAQEQFVSRGMIVDVAIHRPDKEGDHRNHHAHIMLTMREIGPDGFGKKERDWNRKEVLDEWRKGWEQAANRALERAGHAERIDHRSHAARGIELEPTTHVGVHATGMDRKGMDVERVAEQEAVRQANADAIRAEPEKVLAAITSREAVFTRHDMARELNRYIDDPQEFQGIMARLGQSAELVELAPEVSDASGHVIEQARYSTLDMVRTERGMMDTATRMNERADHGVSPGVVGEVIERAGTLTDQQRVAVEHILDGRQVAAVIGDAGTGKSFSMKVAREAWEAEGYRVIGGALAGKAADGLQEGAGIESRTLHSWERAWERAEQTGRMRDRLTDKTVLVIDEAGMVGSRQLARVMDIAERAGAKVVLVGDDKQLQAIEAGAPFRAVVERIGAAEITEIRRQKEGWAKAASMDLARGAVRDGLNAYQAHGQVRMESTRDDARRALVADYLAERREGQSSIVLAHSNADVQALNEAVREHRRGAGELGEGATFDTAKGRREFAAGDRVVFLKNDRALDVKNGMLGTVERAENGRLAVHLDNGGRREVSQDAYADLDHGYAVTVHKSQGVTVDRAYLLATKGMDKHLTYVGMTRHREAATLYAGKDDFRSYDVLTSRLGRERPKASTLDYDTAAFADRRGFDGLAVVRNLVERGRRVVDRLKGRLDAAAERLGLTTGQREEAAQAATWRAQGRVDLSVPYPEKDQAKAVGARFDGERKVWYAPEGANLDQLHRWLPNVQQEATATRLDRERADLIGGAPAPARASTGAERKAALREQFNKQLAGDRGSIQEDDPLRAAVARKQAERDGAADPLASYRKAVDVAQRAGDPMATEVALAKLEVAEEHVAQGKSPRHYAAAIQKAGEERGLERFKAQIDAPAKEAKPKTRAPQTEAERKAALREKFNKQLSPDHGHDWRAKRGPDRGGFSR